MPSSPAPTAGIEPGGSLLGESFDISGMLGQFDGWILENLRKVPELEEEVRQEAMKLGKEAANQGKQIQLEALIKEMTITNKFALMARILVNETLGKFIPDLGKNLLGDKVIRARFDDEKERLKKDGGALVATGNNIIYPSSEGFMGQLQRLMRLPSLLGKDEKENQALRLVTGTTVVMPRDSSAAEPGMFSISFWTQARYYLEAVNPPIKLSLVSLKEAADGKVPAEGEIQVVLVEDKVDSPDFDQLSALFDEGNVQWHAPHAAAAVLVSKMNEGVTDESLKAKAKNVDKVLQGIGVLPFAEDYAGLREQLISLGAAETPTTSETGAQAGAQAAADASVADSTAETPPAKTSVETK